MSNIVASHILRDYNEFLKNKSKEEIEKFNKTKLRKMLKSLDEESKLINKRKE